MNVSACLVTRGDVDMQPILASLPAEWEKIVWDNSPHQTVAPSYIFAADLITPVGPRAHGGPDLAVYGRYAAIEYASHDLIFVQDDDVIVSDPQAIVDAWVQGHLEQRIIRMDDDRHVVCNMPQEFRPHYPDSGLVGFGAAFHRDAPRRAFDRFMAHHDHMIPLNIRQDVFWRRSDNVFTTLTPRVLVDVPKRDCDYASDPHRMWRQSDHVGERDRMIELARQVRDA